MPRIYEVPSKSKRMRDVEVALGTTIEAYLAERVNRLSQRQIQAELAHLNVSLPTVNAWIRKYFTCERVTRYARRKRVAA